jgi:hypothetical protein
MIKFFLKKIVQPLFRERYLSIAIRTYANKKNQDIAHLIHNIKQTQADYIFVADKNSEYTGITAKKKNIQKNYEGIDIDRIIVVIKEIESWYLAGLNEEDSKKLGLPILENTENIGKKKFEEYLCHQKKFKTKDFMTEILKYFSKKTARQKNSSFKIFCGQISIIKPTQYKLIGAVNRRISLGVVCKMMLETESNPATPQSDFKAREAYYRELEKRYRYSSNIPRFNLFSG